MVPSPTPRSEAGGGTSQISVVRWVGGHSQKASRVAEHRPRMLALDLSRVFDIEVSALQMRIEGDKRAAGQGATAWLPGLSPAVTERTRAAGLADRLVSERLRPSARTVIRRYQEHFDAGGPAAAARPVLPSDRSRRWRSTRYGVLPAVG
jgi:hypothetical protein